MATPRSPLAENRQFNACLEAAGPQCTPPPPPLQRSGSKPQRGKVGELAALFARLQATERLRAQQATGTPAPSQPERVAAIRRRFSACVGKAPPRSLASVIHTARTPTKRTFPALPPQSTPPAARAAALEATVKKLEAEIRVLRAVVAAHAPAQAPADAAADVEEDDIEALAECLAAAEQADEELDEAAVEIAALEEALEQAQAEAEEAGAAVDAIDERLRAANAALAASAAREAGAAAEAQAQIAELQQAVAAAEAARTEAAADAAHAAAAAMAQAQADAAAAAASASSARGTAAQSAKALAAAAGEVSQLRRRNAALEARGRDVSARMAALMRKVAAVGGALSGPSDSHASEAAQRPGELLRLSAEAELLALEAAASGTGGSTAAVPVGAGEAEVSSVGAAHHAEELTAQLAAANRLVARLSARVAELESAAVLDPTPPRRSRAGPGLQESLRMATDQVVSRAAALLAAATQPEEEREAGSDLEESSESAPGSRAETPSPAHPWRRGMALLSHAHEAATRPEPVAPTGAETEDESETEAEAESVHCTPDSAQSIKSGGSLRATDEWAAFYLTM